MNTNKQIVLTDTDRHYHVHPSTMSEDQLLVRAVESAYKFKTTYAEYMSRPFITVKNQDFWSNKYDELVKEAKRLKEKYSFEYLPHLKETRIYARK